MRGQQRQSAVGIRQPQQPARPVGVGIIPNIWSHSINAIIDFLSSAFTGSVFSTVVISQLL